METTIMGFRVYVWGTLGLPVTAGTFSPTDYFS